MTLPVLTIITPVLNGRDVIEFCLRDVAGQNCPDIAHLVDGGSTDSTAELERQWITR